MRMDEEQHFQTGLLMVTSRQLVLIAGARLAARGAIRKTEDVFFLELKEMERALSEETQCFRFLVEKRRALFQRFRSLEAPLEIRRQSQDVSEVQDAPLGALVGIPASPGVARGPVFFAEHIHDFRDVQAGAILVTTSLNPALTPAFPLLAGVLSETGGLLSHGFVSAREHGIPGVSGIREIKKKLTPGAWIEVDGNRGTVRIL